MTTISDTLFTSRPKDRGGARLDLVLPAGWPESTEPLVWRWRNAAGEVRVSRGALEEQPPGWSGKLYVWTPATETLLTHANVPTRSRDKIAQALPYVLEEQLLDDPASLHFAWRRDHDGTLLVGVTNKEYLRNCLATLQNAGLSPRALSPAMLLVPWSPNSWSAAFVGNELLVRTGPVGGFACAAETTPPAVVVSSIREAQQQSRTPEFFIVFDPPAGFSADEWSDALGLPVRVESQSVWDAPGDSEPALNLMQGELAPAGELHQSLRPWLPAAIMAGIFLAGTIAFDVVEWWRLNQQHRANVAEMTDILMTAFPDTRVVTDNPLRQMQQGLERLQTRAGLRPNDILPMMLRTLPTLQSQPLVRLRGFEYRDKALTLTVTTTDTNTLESFRQTLQSNGLNAETIESDNSEDGSTRGRIRVELPTLTRTP